MAKQQKRDNAYYEERLKRDHPAINKDYRDGKYRNITEAAIAAGLKTRRTRLQELKNAWEKASPHERNEFERWLHTQYGIVTPHPSITVPIANGRYLLPWAKSRIRAVMSIRGIEMGEVMKEIGEKPLNPSLGSALSNDSRLQPHLLAALEAWLDKNKHV